MDYGLKYFFFTQSGIERVLHTKHGPKYLYNNFNQNCKLGSCWISLCLTSAAYVGLSVELNSKAANCWIKTAAPAFSFFSDPEGKTKKEKGAPIQRSTETGMAVELSRNMSRQPSRESNNGSMNSCNSEGKLVNH